MAKQVPGLRIASTKDGFRRCGVAFSTKPQDFPVSKFTPAQIQALRKDPTLVVTDCQIDSAASDE